MNFRFPIKTNYKDDEYPCLYKVGYTYHKEIAGVALAMDPYTVELFPIEDVIDFINTEHDGKLSNVKVVVPNEYNQNFKDGNKPHLRLTTRGKSLSGKEYYVDVKNAHLKSLLSKSELSVNELLEKGFIEMNKGVPLYDIGK